LLDQYSKLPEVLQEGQEGELTTEIKKLIQENNWNVVFEKLVENTQLLFKSEDNRKQK
jgi:hypothetical protein